MCVCVWIVEKALSLTKILDLLHTSRLCMGTKIKTEIWISFSTL